MDVPENLLALCRECHAAKHNGKFKRDYLFDLIGQREGLWPDQVHEILARLRWA